MTTLYLDFETRCVLDLKAVGTHRYVADPSFLILIINYAIDDGPVISQYNSNEAKFFQRFADALVAAKRIVAHNVQFEQAVTACVIGDNMKVLPNQKWICTAARARRCGLPSSLRDAAKALQLPVQKDTRGKQLIRKLCRPRADGTFCEDPELLEELASYGATDVEVCRQLDHALPELDQIEHNIYYYDMLLNARGVGIDIKLLANMRHIADEATDNVDKAVSELTNNKITSIAQRDRILSWLADYVCVADDLSRQTVRTLLDEHTLPEPVQKMLLLRVEGSRTSTRKLEAFWERHVNGRLYGSLLYYGAHCVPGDTEVLTREGWRTLETWKGGEIVQVTPEGFAMFLPGERFEGPVIEEWIKVTAPYLNCDFTLGHTVPYLQHDTKAWATMQAADLMKRAATYLPLAARLVDSGSITAEQMRVLAMVQADGHWETDSSRGRGLYIFVKKPRKIERARRLLQITEIPFRENEFTSHPEFVRFSIAWHDLPPWLTPERKFFGSWLLDSTPIAREALIDELCYWDGWVQSGQSVYSSSDEVNMDWIVTLAHLTNRCASVSTHVRGENRRVNYRVAIRQRMNGLFRKGDAALIAQTTRAYCAKTKTGFFLARRNGRIFVTGNTGRHSSIGVQLQNLPRPERPWWMLQEAIGNLHTLDSESLRLLYGAPLSLIADLLRSLIVPKPGYVFEICDLNAIELRVAAWLAGEERLLAQIREGVDTYCIMASDIVGREITPADEKERFLGKTLMLAGQYGIGWQRFQRTCETQGHPIDELLARISVNTYRDTHQAIISAWVVMDCAARLVTEKGGKKPGGPHISFEMRGDWLLMHLPSGRPLYYYKPQVEEDQQGAERVTYLGVNSVTHQFERIRVWGGSLFEHAVQAISRDVLMNGCIALEVHQHPVSLIVHDEVVCEVLVEHANARAVETIMSCSPVWAQDLPLQAKGIVSERYRKI